MSDEVYFLYGDEHQSLPQVDTIFSDGLINLYQGNNLVDMSIKDYNKLITFI